MMMMMMMMDKQASQVDLTEFKQRFNKPVGIVIGLVCQFIFLPVAGFACIRIFFPDNPVYGIPLLVTVCSPGGSYSNWWCSLFNSDLPLSMAMTTASSLFAVATLPVNILVYLKLAYPSRDGSVSLDWGGLFTSLAIVVVGIFGGLFIGNKAPRWRGLLGKLGNTSGVCLVLLGFFFSSNSSAPIWARGLDFYIGVGLPCLFGLVISLGFAYMVREERAAVSIVFIAEASAVALYEDPPRVLSALFQIPNLYTIYPYVLIFFFFFSNQNSAELHKEEELARAADMRWIRRVYRVVVSHSFRESLPPVRSAQAPVSVRDDRDVLPEHGYSVGGDIVVIQQRRRRLVRVHRFLFPRNWRKRRRRRRRWWWWRWRRRG